MINLVESGGYGEKTNLKEVMKTLEVAGKKYRQIVKIEKVSKHIDWNEKLGREIKILERISKTFEGKCIKFEMKIHFYKSFNKYFKGFEKNF